jgi:thiol-disulfide isomerase/thioredoxin
MPKFKDTRKSTQNPIFNGWTDEVEPRSPLAELFAKITPLMSTMKRKGAFHFPPPPPHLELPTPPTSTQLPALETLKPGSRYLEWERPELSDYGCNKRTISPLGLNIIAKLASNVKYRLGKDQLRPELPTQVEDSEHLERIFQKNQSRLLVLNFGAEWCHYCQTLAPVYRRLSLENPTALFLKVDLDECEELVARFSISMIPTTFLLRGGTSPPFAVAGLKGGGAEYASEMAKQIKQFSTPDELSSLAKFRSNAPGENMEDVLQNMSSTKEQIDLLASQPLLECCHFVTQLTRAELGLPLVDPTLAFDVSRHEAANTAPAQSVLARFRDDVAAYATQANTVPVPMMGSLSDRTVRDFFEGVEGAESSLNDALARARVLMKKLHYLRDADAQMVQDTVPLLERAANWVPLATGDANKTVLEAAKTRFLLNRFSGQNSFVWIEFLFGMLLSSKGESDLLRLNPYLPADMVTTLMQLVTLTMLRANRLGHTNRCIGTLIGLETLLEKVKYDFQSFLYLTYHLLLLLDS